MFRSKAQTETPGGGFVDPQVLARIDNLELIARTVVDGFINGLHRSPFLGLSLDFAEHRPYMPGDDIRRIDWRLFARTDRHFVKQFEADTNANFIVVLDISRSMDYGSHTVTKLDYARYLAASLAYFSSTQRDRVGLVTFDDDIVDFVPPSAKHLDVVLHTIDRIEAGRPGSLAPPLKKMTENFRRRGVMVVVSDFYEEPTVVVDSIKQLRYRGNDLIVFHILDPDELEFPFEKASSFVDLESGERVPVVPETLREGYRSLIRNHTETLLRLCTENRIDYTLVSTGTPLDYALFRYLSERERLSRVR